MNNDLNKAGICFMKKVMTLPTLISIVLMFFLLYGLAFAHNQKPIVKAKNPAATMTQKNMVQQPDNKNTGAEPVKTATAIKRDKINLTFFKSHLNEDMTQADVIALFGDQYRESLTDQSGEPAWTYDFPNNLTYKTKVPPYAVDEAGILTGKMRYQLSIVWNGDKMKSYIVFYNNHGKVSELKKKFFDGSYINE
jgi:hypothetical protein